MHYIFLGVENPHQYTNSIWSKYLENGKDVFYRFCSNPLLNWRNILVKSSSKLIESDILDNENLNTSCFILDDTDLGKSGRKIEFVGYIWSHVVKKSILGFKSLNLCYWTGTNLFALDFSLHLESGKNKSKPQGLTPKKIKQRFSKQRQMSSCGSTRVKELTQSKIDTAIQLLKRAIKRGYSARYVLVDSWFCCEALIKYVHGISKTDLICRAKLGNAKYLYKKKNFNAKELLHRYKYRKDVRKYSRKLKSHYLQFQVDYKGVPLKLVFLKVGRNKWILILSTNKRLSAIKIVETYQIRWSIEVFFKECKQYLGLGKCQANDFDAQIANTTLSLIRYNWLSSLKVKSENYGIGTLFRATKQSISNPTIIDKIIDLFYKIHLIISEIFDFDIENILEKIFSNDQLSSIDLQFLDLICKFKTCET